MTKEEEIYLYSNPEKVKRIANKKFGKGNYELKISTRKNKKYMIRGDFTDDKWVHFGLWGMEDYTKHNDKMRRELFLNRNHEWQHRKQDTPAYLSYFLLWN